MVQEPQVSPTDFPVRGPEHVLAPVIQLTMTCALTSLPFSLARGTTKIAHRRG